MGKGGTKNPRPVCLSPVSERRRQAQENEEEEDTDIRLERRLHITENWEQHDRKLDKGWANGRPPRN